MMDVKLYKKLYNEGVPLSKMARKLNVCITTIVKYQTTLNLPKRGYDTNTIDYDVDLFIKLYKDGKTYEEIADTLGFSISTAVKIKNKLSLPDRERKPRKAISKDLLIERFNSGDSYQQLCREFDICIDTLKRKLKQCGIQPRNAQPSLYNEQEFREAYAEGLSGYQLAAKFKMNRKTVYVKLKKLGLTEKAPALEPAQAVKNNKSTMTKETIQPAITEPVMNSLEPVKVPVKTNPLVATFSMPPKTLKEIQKLQLQQEMKRAEQKYKVTHKENGYCCLIGKEIDNQIADPFNFK